MLLCGRRGRGGSEKPPSGEIPLELVLYEARERRDEAAFGRGEEPAEVLRDNLVQRAELGAPSPVPG